jgi:restriction endonuclease S subunit
VEKELNTTYKSIKLKWLLDYRGYKSGPFGSALILDQLDTEGELIIYSPEHITNMDADAFYLPEERYSTMSQFFLAENDIFFPIVGTLGKAKIFDSSLKKGMMNQRLARISPDTRKVLPDYLWWCMCEFDSFKEQLTLNSRGAILEHITKDALMRITIPFPNISEQRQILAYLDRRTAEIDSLLADLQSQTEMLDTYKRELIAEAITKGLDKSAAMKDSGVDWIGKIPAHWELLPLFAVATENNVKNTGLVCENLLSLSYGKIIQKDIDTNFGLLPASFEGYQIVQPGYTVLRFTDLQNDKRSLRSGYVTEMGIITSAYMGLIPSERLDSKYFNYLLHAYDLLKVYYGMGGGLRQTLKFSDMKHLPIPIPPISEQQGIATLIDEKTAKVETLIADINAQIKKLKQYRQIVIHDAVTGKIKATEG